MSILERVIVDYQREVDRLRAALADAKSQPQPMYPWKQTRGYRLVVTDFPVTGSGEIAYISMVKLVRGVCKAGLREAKTWVDEEIGRHLGAGHGQMILPRLFSDWAAAEKVRGEFENICGCKMSVVFDSGHLTIVFAKKEL